MRVSSCDGTADLRDQLARIAREAGLQPAELQEAAMPAITELVEQQILVPVAE